MKRIILSSSIALACLSTGALAGNFYLGPSLFYQHNSANHSSFNGVHPRISLGYGTMSGDYYLAGEVFAIPFTSQMSSSVDAGAENAKTKYGYGISFLPGMKISDNVLAYLRLGIINSKFSGPNTSKSGGQIGLGFSTPVSTSWDFRAEYIFTSYQSVSGLGSVKSNEVGIGFIYNFDSTQPAAQTYKS